MSAITPFKISVAEEKIIRLNQKLALSDFPEEINELDAWARGAPLAEVKKLAHYWQTEFNWRKAEAQLNELPQFIATIDVEGFDSYDVHFIHQPSKTANAIPLLFVHGWPGSFIEVTKILPELIDGAKDAPAFHVVAPSLIDFGFSGASKHKSFHMEQHAEAYHKLMLALGYDQYVVAGGDLGTAIARFIALKYSPSHCKAQYITNAVPAEPTATSHPELHAKIQNTPLSSSELAGLARSGWFSTEGNGYYKQQSTKPQTISFSLADSPIGLLAWIYEKLHDWTDSYPWTNDEILTWVSIYYFSTAGPAAPNNIYYEGEHRIPGLFAAMAVFMDCPLGIARFPKDLILLPKKWNETLGPIVFEREHESGGHFASWERPGEVVEDLREMFGRGGKIFGCVEGASGFDE